MTKIIRTKVESCLSCPLQKDCVYWYNLSSLGKSLMEINPGFPKILENCPLPNDNQVFLEDIIKKMEEEVKICMEYKGRKSTFISRSYVSKAKLLEKYIKELKKLW